MAKDSRVRFEDRALDTALELAAERGWERLHLYDVADRMGVPLADLRVAVADLDALGTLIFRRADQAMLAPREAPDFLRHPVRQRLGDSLEAWFDALAPHKPAVKAILGYKLAPAHIHHHAGMVVGLSRTVQWWREAAGLTAAPPLREREEIALSAIFGLTLLRWLADGTTDHAASRRFLRCRLAAPATWLVWPPERRPAPPAPVRESA